MSGSPFIRDPGIELGLEGEITDTLIGDLVNTVDELRNLAVNLGVRPWRVFRVWVTWDGDVVGEGDPTVVESEILPAPKVTEKATELGAENSKRRRSLESGGMTENGVVDLSGISLTYSEDQILGKVINADDENSALGKNVEFFYELRGFEPGGRMIRFTPVTVPIREYGSVGWTMTCEQQRKRRTRSGGVV